MYTSIIRHPKRSRYVQLYDWQLVACHGEFNAAALLSFLEDELLKLVCSERKDKNKGWMGFTEQELLKAAFARNKRELTSAIATLELIGFIKTDVPSACVTHRDHTFLFLDAVRVNQWIDEHQKPIESVEPNSQFASLFLMLACINKPKSKLPSGAAKAKATELFDFWKSLTNHPRAKVHDRWLKLICDRLNDGYDYFDLAQAIIGVTYSDHHMGRGGGPKYDGIKYIFGDTEKVDRMMALAQQNSQTREIVEKRLNEFFGSESQIPMNLPYTNQATGSQLL